MRKNRLLILICILAILIITTILLIIKTSKKTENLISESTVETIKENTVIPGNSYDFFSKYKNGCMSSKEIYEKISDFYKIIIPFYYNDLKDKNSEEILEYYNSNKSKINNDIKISDDAEFLKFAKLITKMKLYNANLEWLEFEKGTINEQKYYTTCNVKIKYSNNEVITMKVKAYINNQENGKNIEFSL